MQELQPAADAWAPTTGFPLEYSTNDIFASPCSLQAYVPEPSGGQQLVVEQYNHSAAASQYDGTGDNNLAEVVDGETSRIVFSNDSCARYVLEIVEKAFRDDMELVEKKMHRYPPVLRSIGESYTVPRLVAIGPYHHHRAELKQVEKVKHMAAIQCVKQSGHLLEDLFSAVAYVADRVRWRLYDKDVIAGISCDDFRHMMFFDACFLVQYLRRMAGKKQVIDESLYNFLRPNGIDILHDVMLLENQIPWPVVETVMSFTGDSLKDLTRFIPANQGWLQDEIELPSTIINNNIMPNDDAWDSSYNNPPHLLAVLRHYIVRRPNYKELLAAEEKNRLKEGEEQPKKFSFSSSAIELAEIGITLTSEKTGKIMEDIVFSQEGNLFAELRLPALSLDRDRASLLISMAALELCTVKRFTKAAEEDSAVCSYLLLLSMLVYTVEDVHQLRARGVLHGGGGLTNEDALRFFTSVQGLRFGRRYMRIMEQIMIYKKQKRVNIKCYKFFYKNRKIIYGFVTLVGLLVGIKKAL